MDEEIGIAPTSSGVNDEIDLTQGRPPVSHGEDEDETEERDTAAAADISKTTHLDMVYIINNQSRVNRSGEIFDLTGDDLPPNEHKPKYINKLHIFEGLKEVPLEVKSEGDFFSLFWTPEIWETMTTETNKYGDRMANWTAISIEEMRRFFGMMAFFGFIKVVDRRELWNQNSRLYNPFLANCMTRHRFEDILKNLHWEDTSVFTRPEITAKNKADCFWRVATLEEKIRLSFQKYYTMGRDIDVDEQGIPTRCRHHAVQYNGDKPHKWFFKVYGMNCAKTGYMSNFYLFRGKDGQRPDDVSASAYPVIKLTEPDQYHNRNHICYIDNYFNSVKLLEKLLGRGIHGGGTVRSNRVKSCDPNVNLFWSKTAKPGSVKGKKGDVKQHQIGDSMYVTSWYDKKPVNMLATYRSKMALSKRNEVDVKTQAHSVVDINKPTIVFDYNGGMGGTDLFDQFMAYYRTGVKTIKWPHSIIFHLFSCCIVNAWILYKLRHKITDKHAHGGNLYSFQNAIITFLCPPASSTSTLPAAADFTINHKCHATGRPFVDNPPIFNGHFVHYYPKSIPADHKNCRGICKWANCKRKVTSLCRACKVHLCTDIDSDGSTCFEKYHAAHR